MDDIFEIRDLRVNKDEVIRKLTENLKKHRSQGGYTAKDESQLYATTPVATRRATLDNDLGRLKNSTSVLNLSYEISSHRKVLGPPLVYGRRLINGEVRRYVDPSLSAQSYFNADVVRVLAELSSRGELTDQSLDHLKTSLYADMDQLVIRKVNEVAISIETDLTRMAMLSDQIRDVGAGEARSGGDTSAAPAASVDYAQFAQAIGRSWDASVAKASTTRASSRMPSAYSRAAVRC
jgi:hypothetical protein